MNGGTLALLIVGPAALLLGVVLLAGWWRPQENMLDLAVRVVGERMDAAAVRVRRLAARAPTARRVFGVAFAVTGAVSVVVGLVQLLLGWWVW